MSLYMNVHKIASSLIPRSKIEYGKATSSITTSAGIRKTGARTWKTINAHVQPGIVSSFGGKNISEKDYKEMGLDWARRYFTIWTDDESISTIAKQDTCDQVKINNDVFNVLHVAEWDGFSGFRRIYVGEVIA